MKNLAIAVVLTVSTLMISALPERSSKIGYVDVEFIVNQLDETKKIEERLIEENKLSLEKYRLEKEELTSLINRQLKETRKSQKVTVDSLRTVLLNLEESLNKTTKKKRIVAMQPVFKRISETVKIVSDKMGYDVVLNSSIDENMSLLVVARLEDDLTLKTMKRLEIDEKLYIPYKKRQILTK